MVTLCHGICLWLNHAHFIHFARTRLACLSSLIAYLHLGRIDTEPQQRETCKRAAFRIGFLKCAVVLRWRCCPGAEFAALSSLTSAGRKRSCIAMCDQV